MWKLKYKTTVGDLINSLSKFNKDLPIYAINPDFDMIDIGHFAEVSIGEYKKYSSPEEVSAIVLKVKYTGDEYPFIWTTPEEVEATINYFSDNWGSRYKGFGLNKEEHKIKFKEFLDSFKSVSDEIYIDVITAFVNAYQKKCGFSISNLIHELAGINDRMPKMVGEFICKQCVCKNCQYHKEHFGFSCEECKTKGYIGYEWDCDE